MLLINMCNILELSGHFVCPGGTLRFSVPFGGKGTEKIVALWFARGWDKEGGRSVLRLTLCLQKKFSTYTYKN